MDRLEVGYVARAHGVRGELRVQLHDPASQVLFGLDAVWIGGEQRRVEGARRIVGAVLLTVEGVADRTAAEALRGKTVEVPRAAIVLAPGEFLLADLPGCEVVDVEGRPLGKVVEVLPSAQDILVIRDARLERMLPVVPEFVRAVDLEARRIVVELPEDLPAEPHGGG